MDKWSTSSTPSSSIHFILVEPAEITVHVKCLQKRQHKQLTWQAKQCLEAITEIVILATGWMKDRISKMTPHWLLLLWICNMWYYLQYTLCTATCLWLMAKDRWQSTVIKCSFHARLTIARGPAIAKRPTWCSVSVEMLSTVVPITQTNRVQGWEALFATVIFLLGYLRHSFVHALIKWLML